MAASNKKFPKKIPPKNSTLSERFIWQQTEIMEKRGTAPQQQVVRNQSSATSTQQQQRVTQSRAAVTDQV